MPSPYLSIIVPAYNEAERIPKALIAMDACLHNIDFSYEILVVNDGSTDKTAEVVSGMTKLVRNLKLIDVGKNVGKGGAVREGMLRATGMIRIFTDADNSTSIDQFEKMVPCFKEDYTVVIGSRTAKGAVLEPPEPWYRGVAGKGLNLFVQALLLWGFWDTQCGFKAFTAEAAEKIFSETRIGGWAFDVEALSLAKKFGYRIKEIPVRWVDDTRSHVKFSAGFEFIRDVVKIRWWLWGNAYDAPRVVQKEVNEAKKDDSGHKGEDRLLL